MTLQILHKNDVPSGGFEGIRENRLVVEPKVFGKSSSSTGSWPGLGNFVYLADANIIPKGESKLHPHKEVDVISVIVRGRLSHEGSLNEGGIILENQAQVQRAGGEGFLHNEMNPDHTANHMIQMWATPEQLGQPAGYKFYKLEKGKLTRIYGGPQNQDETYPSKTIVEVGSLDTKQTISIKKPFLAYLAKGKGIANENPISEGDLIRSYDDDLTFNATEDCQLIVVTLQ